MVTEPAPDALADTMSTVRAVLGDHVEAESVEPLGAGIGLLSSLVRVRLRDGRRLIVKSPAGDPTTHAIAHRFGYYAREAGTYESLLPRAGVRTPHCHGVVDTPNGPALVLDDLSSLRAGDQLTGATAAEAFAAADFLAALHAAFWNDPVLAACGWLPGPTDPVIAGYGQLFALTWDAFRARTGELIPAAHLDVAERAIESFDAVVARFASAPRTLVHGDFRLDNLLLDDPTEDPDTRAEPGTRTDRTDQTGPITASPTAFALDWQLAAWGRGAYDLALFCAGSVETDQRRAIERDLVDRYHAALVDRGVTAYSIDDCRRDYQLAHVLNLPNPVTALVAVPPATERGRRMLEANARRALAAVADHAPSLAQLDV